MTQLHSEQDAIKQAVGARYWGVTKPIEGFEDVAIDVALARLSDTLQDPALWQALGRARGSAVNQIVRGA